MDDKKDGDIIDARKYPITRPQFSEGGLEPRYVFLMRTKKDPTAWRDELYQDLKTKMPSAPEAALKAVIERNTQGVCTFEIHSMVAAENVKTGEWQIYAGDYHGGHADPKKDHGDSRLLKTDNEENNEENVVGNARLNAMRVQFDPDWNGEREPAMELDVESMSELWDKLGERKDEFMKVWPETITADNPVTASMPSVKVRGVSEAVGEIGQIEKKYGKKAAAALLKRLGDKGITL